MIRFGNGMHALKEFYFSQYENRTPPKPLAHNRKIEFLWQVAASCAAAMGLWYLVWRWTSSLNYDALWFSVPVVMAETLSFVGMLLYFHNLWSVNDTPQEPAPSRRDQVVCDNCDRVLSVDVFLPTYTEDPEMTRYSIRDALALHYPHPIDIRVHVLDDGNRAEMKKVALEEGVNYLTRETNIGYKAGNLRNGMEQTDGDFLVILDSDTRVFPTLLENTLGYFRDPDLAWVQTPQWFYDIPEGKALDQIGAQYFGRFGAGLGVALQRIFGPITCGKDPFVSDAQLFYDVILRRRNGANASFCCGAGSIHRREAVMEAALRAYSSKVDQAVNDMTAFEKCPKQKRAMERAMVQEFAITTEFTPYKFHVSEDIYTSIVLQSDPDRNWKSVLHPGVETKMLSPLDMQSWAMQRFKYAGGTLDIMAHDNPLFSVGMTLRQKLMYAMTFWSYLAPLWTVIFIAAPIFALFTGITPVAAYSWDFFGHLLPFLLVHELASILGTWGLDNRKGKMLNLAFFSFNLQAIWAIVCGREIRFKVTPKTRATGNFLRFVAPQIAVVALCISAIIYAAIGHVLDPDPQKLTALIVNGFWAGLNGYAMTVLIGAALWKPEETALEKVDVKNRLKFRRTA
jgi:cellulose synthase (UDP-forming)